jgi:hypothetical protein
VILLQIPQKCAPQLLRIVQSDISVNFPPPTINFNAAVWMVAVRTIKWHLLGLVANLKLVQSANPLVQMDFLVREQLTECKYVALPALQVRFVFNFILTCFPLTVCAENQVNVDGVCLNKVQLGESCISPLQCPETSTCEESKCVCQPHYEEIDGVCVKGKFDCCVFLFYDVTRDMQKNNFSLRRRRDPN